MACYANVATKPEEETIIVSILAKLGAVFYVKTTTPTAMMMMETISNVWGETNGAYHSGTSSGGSSGGEGVLLAMRGSPLGVGTDIGGSIRIPAAFNSLYGLKPTFVSIPSTKQANTDQREDLADSQSTAANPASQDKISSTQTTGPCPVPSQP
jgi:amidase